MKKFTAVLLALMFILLCACNSGTSGEEATNEITTREPATLPPEASTAESVPEEEIEPARVLTVYFSHLDPVEGVAEYIKETTEGGILRIETEKVYPETEAELVKFVADEHARNARPALKNAPPDLLSYDIIFLCFPAWDGTIPMALCTFMEDYDMRDKAVIPVIYGTENELNEAMADINAVTPQTMLINGYHFTTDLVTEKDSLSSWISSVLYG
jgi:flavodoxin